MARLPQLSSAVTGAMVACALLTTGLVVRREFYSPPSALSRQLPDREVANWDQLVQRGRRYSETPASSTLLVFTDFECPACKYFHSRTLPALRARFGDRLAIQYRNWPLSYHGHARAAAIAAECAGEQGKYFEFADALFEHQAVLDTVDLRVLAEQVGVERADAFAECEASERLAELIDADIEAVTALESVGTPTLILDGLLLGSGPDSSALIRRVAAKLE